MAHFLPPNAPLHCHAVGVNIAGEKIVNLLQHHYAKMMKPKGARARSVTQVFVCSIGRNLFEERMQIVSELWNLEIRVEEKKKKK